MVVRLVTGFETASSHVGIVVGKPTLRQLFSEYFGFLCQAFRPLFHIHHQPTSYGAGIIGQRMTLVTVGSVQLDPPKKKKSQDITKPEDILPHSQDPYICPYPETDQSSLHYLYPIILRSILLLSTHLRLGLPRGSFSSDLSTSNLHEFLFCPFVLLILFDFIILIILGEEHKSRSSSSCSFLSPPVPSPPSVKMASTAPCSQTLLVYVPPLMPETQVSHHYRTKSKIIVMHILIFNF
jgi:hypothetical protein